MTTAIAQFLGGLRRFPRKFQLLLSLLCVLFVLLVVLFSVPLMNPIINRLNFFIYDHVVSAFPHPYREVNKVVIVDIDDESLAKEGRWPWPRNKIAQLLANLQEAGIVVAGMDIVMSSPEINYALGLKNTCLCS